MEYSQGKRSLEDEMQEEHSRKKSKPFPEQGESNLFSPFCQLPDETMIEIFKWIEPKQLHLGMALVNSRWNRLSRDKCFAHNDLTLTGFDREEDKLYSVLLLRKFKGAFAKATLLNSSRMIKPWWNSSLVTDALENCGELSELRVEMNMISADHLAQLVAILKARKNTLKVLKIQFYTGTEKLTVKMKACLEQIFACVSESTITDLKLHMDTILTIDRSLPLPFPSNLTELEVFFTGYHQSSTFARLFVAANQNTLAQLSTMCQLDPELVETINTCKALKRYHHTKFPIRYETNEAFVAIRPFQFEEIKLSVDSKCDGELDWKLLTYFQNTTSLALNDLMNGDTLANFNCDFRFVSELSFSGNSRATTYFEVASKFPRLKVLNISLERVDYKVVCFLERAIEELPLRVINLKYSGSDVCIEHMIATVRQSKLCDRCTISVSRKIHVKYSNPVLDGQLIVVIERK